MSAGRRRGAWRGGRIIVLRGGAVLGPASGHLLPSAGTLPAPGGAGRAAGVFPCARRRGRLTDRGRPARVPAGVRAGCCSLAFPVLSVSCITIDEGKDKLGGHRFFYCSHLA